jgi:Flp pilus assembly pilin Flp
LADKRHMWKRLAVALWRDENGQDLIEYALLLAFVALVCVGLMSNVGTSMTTLWNSLSDATVDAVTAMG